MDASHVYVGAWALGCFYIHISTRTFRRAPTASVDSCVEIECPFSGVTKSGRVWRKEPESEAWSVSSRLSAPTAVLTRVPPLAVLGSADVSGEDERSRGHGARGRDDVLQPTPPHHHHHSIPRRRAATPPHRHRDHLPWRDVNDAARVTSPASSAAP